MRNDGERIVSTHQDRRLRFGADLVFAIWEAFQTKVVMVNKSDEMRYEEEYSRGARGRSW